MRNRVLTATDPTGHRDLALDQGGGGGVDIRLPLLSKGEAEKALKSIGQTAVTTASFIPGVGDAIDVYDFMAALYRGEYGEAGFVLAAAALPGSARAARNVGGEVVERIARNLDETEGVFRHLDNDAGNLLDKLVANPCSFSGDTLVLTEDGLAPIAEVGQHEYAWAYNEETGEFGFYPIVAVWAHEDPVVLHLKIDGETLVTTPNHPFYTVAGEWVHAGDLQVGDEIRTAAWGTGTVEAIHFTVAPQPMYNFTVAIAHTYFVGDGQWLVHNSCIDNVFSGRKAMLDDMVQRGVNGAEGFQLIRGGKSHVQINNQNILDSIQETFGSTRGWVKVYEDGYDTFGDKASYHYFLNTITGEAWGGNIKPGWSN